MPPRSPDARALLRNGSRTFHAASWLLPRDVRAPARVLYAWCRIADDMVDDGRGGEAEALAHLRRRLDAIYAGVPLPEGVDPEFAALVARHAIPRTLPEALLEGFAWDLAGRRYEDVGDVHEYAARVAGSVGVMMALVMGVRSRSALARACDLGIAMQLTNIARDVGEDARAGRVYLPLRWLRAAGIDPDAWLAQPVHSPPLGGVVLDLLGEAARLYRRASGGIAELPLASRPGISAAARLYAAIGDEIARRGGDAVTRRAVVPARRKAALCLDALAQALLLRPGEPVPPLPAAAFLAHAVPAVPVQARGGVARTLELFIELERRERARHAAGDD